jgi:hypothetical protein
MEKEGVVACHLGIFLRWTEEDIKIIISLDGRNPVRESNSVPPEYEAG